MAKIQIEVEVLDEDVRGLVSHVPEYVAAAVSKKLQEYAQVNSPWLRFRREIIGPAGWAVLPGGYVGRPDREDDPFFAFNEGEADEHKAARLAAVAPDLLKAALAAREALYGFNFGRSEVRALDTAIKRALPRAIAEELLKDGEGE